MSAAPPGTPDPLPRGAAPTTTATPTSTGTDDAGPDKTGQTPTNPAIRPSSQRPSSSPPPPPAPKPRVIEVGGVTLDNRNPQTMCTLFENKTAGIAVKLRNIRVSGKLTMDPGTCATNGEIEGSPQCVSGMTLERGAACFTGTAATATTPDEYIGYVRIDVQGRCASAGPKACSGPEFGGDPPTAARPVTVTWTVRSEKPVCYAVRAPDDVNQDKFCFKTDE
ncbi:hypothetical protein Apa02nite_031650 [Actinoplanes palleronii]|uniref:Neocarzinostatin family protein n=1 Tax=Actinoplanes palleronii TaxID=113570 RepID=A0ABQ4B8N6_9ACTN|nr:hypothetical protein Apa02nite_031650 [Actinoplanes palleronii]